MSKQTMNDKEFKSIMTYYKETIASLKETIRAFEKIKKDWLDPNASWRNVDWNLLTYIYSTYSEDEVLNCYGDIFFIVSHKDDEYIGKRILWGLTLSEEEYKIKESRDEDGTIDYTVEVIK